MNNSLFLFRHPESLGLEMAGKRYALDTAQVGSLDELLASWPAAEIAERLTCALGKPIDESMSITLPPVGNQEIWASGVTYKRSEEAREAESHQSTIYSRVYNAKRPELFFKAIGSDVVGSGETVGIRSDSNWTVPEPELVVVLNARMEVVGFTIGNDMSSRDIEGENPLYLPQAKTYSRSCAIGPRLWLQPGVTEWPDVTIHLNIHRAGQIAFKGETSTRAIHRPLPELIDYLGRAKEFRRGVFLFTGTGIVPPDEFKLQAGDEIHIAIDPIGELVNRAQIVGH